MTEKIKFKAANPPKIMKDNHFAHSAMYSFPSVDAEMLDEWTHGQSS